MRFVVLFFVLLFSITAVAEESVIVGDVPMSFSELSTFPQIEYDIKEENIYHKRDTGVYSGPLLIDVLRARELDDKKMIKVLALDDFSNEIPIDLILNYKPILAIRKNGKPMPVDDKGPFRIIWPSHKHIILGGPSFRLRWVWFVGSIIGK